VKAMGLCSLLALASCAPAALTALDASHPASPHAEEAPPLAVFKALEHDVTAERAEARDGVSAPASEPNPPPAHSHPSHGGHRHDR